ncbi:MAG: alpha/beta fold hydrolase [Schwartzia sp.]|nr:alpha/beta fold hydrolase [Schwartzia sp. (in: firmicutes)]MBR1759938.1 alpha/beta fold hydrolase [Schwartzia sp. (in: firmicutes)]
MVIQGAEPFYCAGGETGVLLLHGLTGSPAEMRLLGESLAEAGFTVLAVRLPGHGTIPEDLERMTAGDWLSAAMDGYAVLASDARVRRIAVVGHSMGALLALMLASLRDVSKVVSVAAPIVIRKERGLSLLPPRELSKGMFLPKKQPRLPGIPVRCLVGYAVMPLLSVHELLSVIASAKEALPQVTAPLFVVQGERDHTVAPESADYILARAASREKKLTRLPRAGHRVLLGVERVRAFSEIIAFLRADEFME